MKIITIGIIAVPTAVAQQTADMLINAGVKGLLNFAPVPPLRLELRIAAICLPGRIQAKSLRKCW